MDDKWSNTIPTSRSIVQSMIGAAFIAYSRNGAFFRLPVGERIMIVAHSVSKLC